MEVIQTKPELDSYSVSMLCSDTLELTDILTLIAVKSVNEGFPGAVDAVKVEDQNEVPVEHGFYLLDMDRGRDAVPLHGPKYRGLPQVRHINAFFIGVGGTRSVG
jgi:hypothetical protein